MQWTTQRTTSTKNKNKNKNTKQRTTRRIIARSDVFDQYFNNNWKNPRRTQLQRTKNGKLLSKYSTELNESNRIELNWIEWMNEWPSNCYSHALTLANRPFSRTLNLQLSSMLENVPNCTQEFSNVNLSCYSLSMTPSLFLGFSFFFCQSLTLAQCMFVFVFVFASNR